MKSQVLITGTFNICHAGHIELFEFGRKFGEVTVGINSDEYMYKKYGNKYIPMVQRAYVISSNKFVKDVVFFNEDHPGLLIQKLKPKYYIKGPDYFGKELPEKDFLGDTKLIIHKTDKIQNAQDLLIYLPK